MSEWLTPEERQLEALTAKVAELERLRKLEHQRVTDADFERLARMQAEGEKSVAESRALIAELDLDEKHAALLAAPPKGAP